MPVLSSSSENHTAQIATDLAAKAANGDVFLLTGPLGAGKSVFARGFIRALAGANIDVPSPTFTLVQTYDTDKGMLWHFDLYRLKEAEELYEIGWEDALSDGILLIEWPERLGHLHPRKARSISIEPLGADERRITIDD